MDFKKQIKHPKWQKKRLEILERDEYTCQTCGEEDKQLHVHHYLYKKNTELWDYDSEYLTTLCENCHSQWHDVYDSIKEILCMDLEKLGQVYELLCLVEDFNLMDLVRLRRIVEEIRNIN